MLDYLITRTFGLALIGNLALLALILVNVPRSLRLRMEAEYLRQQAELLKRKLRWRSYATPNHQKQHLEGDMKTLFCLITAAGLYYEAGVLNKRFINDTEIAIHAPLRKGQVNSDMPVNDCLDDPREVAKTPEAQVKLAEARKYHTASVLCFYGSVGFCLLAVAIPILRRLPKEQPPCDSSES